MIGSAVSRLVAFALLAFVAGPLAAQEGQQEPPPPPKDRIELTNGDTLSGTIKSMEGGTITLTTDLVGDLEIKLDDVKNITTGTPLIFRKPDGTRIRAQVTGYSDGQFQLAPATPDEQVPPTLATADVDKINPTPAQWSGALNFGFAVSDGNVERRNFTASFDAVRRSEIDRITLNGLWLYADDQKVVSGTTIIDRVLQGSVKYDFFLIDKLYATGSSQVGSNFASDVKLRWNIDAGLGYQWFEDDDFKLSTDVAVGYLSTEYRDPTALKQQGVTLRLAYNLEWAVLSSLRLLSTAEYLPILGSSDDYVIRGNNRLRLDLLDSLFAQFEWIAIYNNTPPAGFERLDNKYLFTLGWEF